jgi:predicted dinucleotide-binding enzyme
MPSQSKLRIGIIGAGNIGGTLTRRLTSLGHDVAVANSRGPETLAKLAAETGAKAVTVEERPFSRPLNLPNPHPIFALR